ncbi:short-chain dehydrogenase/reductase SDR [Catenovulum agarivorans DS-2]|uniref:Short-chain dehydrogenase/reductase SDR n=1 Tax=Catenovulum agarivorans DS-2 TaxID=1328313 RepID=W7QE39_9ALTE|nr:SDR family oxidoreductase [Catenovulum agarivorans]EWH10186.1 short-chain dehydrogenase/reductase SDR [Catenovulum agarivorans DS-2]
MQNWVLVTGADRGLGLAFVTHYLSLGCHVIATTRREQYTNELAELQRVHSTKLDIQHLDLADEQSINSFAQQLADKKRKLDLVINNAGISQIQQFGRWDSATFLQHFMVNSVAPALVAQAAIPFITAGGKLVQITSGVASLQLNIGADIGLDAYAASKAALNSISRRLSAKVAEQNIIVTLLNPGWVQTDMGGEQATMSIEDAIKLMTQSIEKLTLEQSGKFIEADGSIIPW